MTKNNRYSKAIHRNLCEIVNAIHERQVLISLEEFIKKNGDIYYHGGSFFQISRNALFNDMISHVIKVLDSNAQSTSFWYILKSDEFAVKSCESYSEDKISYLQKLQVKLKKVRDKTHFHIDKDGVLSPEAVWKEAGIKGNDLGKGLEYLLDILLEMHNKILGGNLSRNNYEYKGEDFLQLLELARTNELIEVYQAHPNQN